ncbi:MAG: NADH-ubiquinone oxidoreductase-F iron-sulfur binding region domain-containing protein [Bacteroidales bacterium]|nr:NADH-ubiquinone oxidoreductase-F iron-sulfur binding region domain-containing protein [Bacteroidales bacterium]
MSHESRKIKNPLISSVVLNETNEYPRYIDDKLSQLRRLRVEKPIIYIGAGTCGIVAGAHKSAAAVRNYLNEFKIKAEVIEVGCIGLCSAEPLIDIQLPGKNRLAFSNITHEKVFGLLDAVFNNTLHEASLYQFKTDNLVTWEGVPFISQIDFFSRQKRIVLKNCGIIDPLSIEEYIAYDGYKAFGKAILNYTSADICQMIELSGLRGRGGGGFPTGEKWNIALNAQSDQKYLICNADESDPGAFMDRALIEGDPHKLIEGMAIAAYAIGASQAFVYIRSEYKLAVKNLENAIQQARDMGLIGNNILDSGFNFYLQIKIGAGAFVCGEETALINSIEGKRGTPEPKPPYPAVKGLFGKPTIVNNVETLANVPSIVQNGPGWFTNMGTETSKGTKVFALSGKSLTTGLIEVEMGTTFRTLIYDIAGGVKDYKDFKAMQIGGPSGACLDSSCLDIPIDYENLEREHAMMGSGGLVLMDENTCMVDVSKFFMKFLQNESCGKCIPCREGTRRMLEILESITKKPTDDDKHESLERFKGVMMLEELAEVIQDTSLCGLGQTAPNPVISTLRYFRDEFEEHIFDRQCRANVCKGLKTFYIHTDKCTGCTICSRKCPTSAIIGVQRNPHFIVQDKCIGCGICYEACKFNAISVH